jgi:hypothetical protein
MASTNDSDARGFGHGDFLDFWNDSAGSCRLALNNNRLSNTLASLQGWSTGGRYPDGTRPLINANDKPCFSGAMERVQAFEAIPASTAVSVASAHAARGACNAKDRSCHFGAFLRR